MKWWKLLIAINAIIVGSFVGIYFGSKPDKTVDATGVSNRHVSVNDIDLYSLWTLVNNERISAGLKPLSLNPQLDKSGQAKCDDMVARNYWSHNTPDGLEPWTFIEAENVNYYKAGENLAYGSADAQAVVNNWMLSPEHRANILDKSYTDVGYAKCISYNYLDQGPQVIVVQHFIGL